MKKITEKNIAAVASVIACITALVALGPCASKDYVDVRIKEARASATEDIVRADKIAQEYRDRMHGDLAEIRTDVKQILVEIGELRGANAKPEATNKAIEKKAKRSPRISATACR